jgi:protein ImuB
MFLCLLMPDFRLQAALRWREASGPAALVEEKSGLLLEVNAGAAARGILPGLTGPQAMARDERILLLPPSPSQEECLAHLLTARALSLSPDVENTAPGLVLADLSHAARSLCWQQLAEGVVRQFRVDALEVQAGVAATPDLAVLAARGARPAAVIYDASAFVAALPIGALEPSESLRLIFQDWGLKTVGDFLRLPRAGVVERLGPEAQEMLRRVSGRHKRPLRLVRTPPEYAEAFDFEYEVETAEPLLFLLRRFLGDLTVRLREAGRVAGQMTLSIPLNDGSRHERTFCIPAPTAEVEVLFRILHTHVETLQLTQRPVGVRLQLEDMPPTGDQLRLFESALRDPNRFGETLARLKALAGNDGVGVPQPEDTHEPDRFVLRDNFPARPASPGGTVRGLPLRRCRPAETGRVSVQNGRPVSLAFPSASGEITRSSGPFRMSGHWWDAQSWEVEEWDVELSDGSLFRLACRGGRWTVEGCYEVR